MNQQAVLPLLFCLFGWFHMQAAEAHPPNGIIQLQEVICTGQSYTLGTQSFSETGVYDVSVNEDGEWVDYRLTLTVLEPDASWAGDTQLHCDHPSVTLQATGPAGPGTIHYKWERQTGEFTVDNISYASSVSISQTGTYFLQVTQQYQGVYCADRSWAIPVGVETTVYERYDTMAPGETIFIQGHAISEGGVYEWTITSSGICTQLIRAYVTVAETPPPSAICRTSLSIDLNNQCWTEVTKEQIITSGINQVASLVVQDNYAYNEGFVEGPGTFWAEAYSAESEMLCRTQVTIRDATAPIILPRSTEVMLHPTGTTTINPWTLVDDAYDACSSITLTATPAELTVADMGHRTVQLTATDESGHQTRVSTIITVQPPVCLPDLRWPNTLISGTYRARGPIIIATALDSAALVVLEGQSVTLKPGFRSGSGGTFRASAEPCGDTRLRFASSGGDEVMRGVGDRESLLRPSGLRRAENGDIVLRVFPNPLVTEGVISLEISDASEVSLHLVDAMGRPVRTYESAAFLAAGTFTYSLIPGDVPKGWYVLIAQTESGIFQEKVLVK